MLVNSRRAILAILGAVVMNGYAEAADVWPLTSDPGAWRPLAYAELQKPTAHDATYADIWKDAIDANNRTYEARGDRRYSGASAQAAEAHFVIWSAKRSVVLSMLDTAVGCMGKLDRPGVMATVKLCPMRIAIYEGIRVRTLDAGRGCFVEPAPGATLDPSATVAYGAYDIASRTLKIGIVVNHRAVDGCSLNIPLPRD